MGPRTPWIVQILLAAAWLIFEAQRLPACPFCSAVKPSLCQRREEAQVVALGEVIQQGDAGRIAFRLHQVSKGKERLADSSKLVIATGEKFVTGTLAILFGEGDEKTPAAELEWSVAATNEIGYAYFVRAPTLRVAAPQRLRYFARHLEHAEPQIAEDVLSEFGLAPYDALVQIADALPSEKLRTWLADPRIAPQRKGFYGLALGLAGQGEERAANREFLRRLVLEPADDFRAGFDGILGGYLVAAGEKGLELLESQILANPASADGDVRHGMSALRFYYEFGREIPAERLCQALRHLLVRPEFAATTMIDLTRWQDWDAVPQIGKLYEPKLALPTRRAIVSYLIACPTPAGKAELERLKKIDPEGIRDLERGLASGGQSKRTD